MVSLLLIMAKIPRWDVSASTVTITGVKQGDHTAPIYQSKDVSSFMLGIVRDERQKFAFSFLNCESYAKRII